MPDRPADDTRLLKILLAGLTVLLVLSVYYWRERVFILDAAYQSFHILMKDDFAFQVKRYGAAMVQVVPLLLSRLHLPIDVVLTGYSMAFTVYPILLFGLLWWLKARDFAKMLALYFLLLMAHTFFWIQSEMIQATALTLFTMGVYRSARMERLAVRYGLALGLTLLTVYTHPLSVVALLYGYTYLALDDFARAPRWRWLVTASFLPVTGVLFGLKQFVWGTGAYDSSAMEMLNAFPIYIYDVFQLGSTKLFYRQVLSTYHLLPVTLLIALFFLLRNRKWLKTLALLLGIGGWLSIVLTTFHYVAVQFYIESYYLMLGYFLAFPLVLDVFPRVARQPLEWLFSGLIVYRVVMIAVVSDWFVERKDYLDTIVATMQELPDQRYVIQEAKLNNEALEQQWSLAFETGLLSISKDPGKLRTLTSYSGEERPEYIDSWRKNSMPMAWGPYPYTHFTPDNAYFQFRDSSYIEELRFEK